MKSAAALLVAAAAAAGTANAKCSLVSDVRMTFYGYPDNSPPSGQTAYDCLGRNYTAGGSGTWEDPLTFASSKKEYSVCQVIYSPYLKKYLIMQDDCQECDSDNKKGIKHIDVWTGSANINGGSGQEKCEDELTPNHSQTLVVGPASTSTVDSDALYASPSCFTVNTFPSATAAC